MTDLDAFDRTLAAVDGIIGAVTPARWDDPTPCPDWSVRTLINHLVQVNLEYAAIADGQPDPGRGPDPIADDRLGDDPLTAFRSAGQTARSAFSRPGMLEQPFRFPWGEEPGARIVRHVVNELLIHGWDLAKATGQPTDLPPDLVEGSLSSWRAWFDRWPRSSGGNFGPEQPAPEGASAADRLTAFLGRRS